MGGAAQAAARAAAERLPLPEQVGQLVILRFAGSSPPAYVGRILREGRAAGVILFEDNVASSVSARSLTGELQRAGRGGVLVAIDQEGGAARILEDAGPVESQLALTTRARARSAARRAGSDLRAAGVNVNLAPVADVPSAADSALRGRSFPGDARRVAALTAAAVSGYGDGDVAPTVKHFPGLGAAPRSTDEAPVTIGRPRRELELADLAPFRAAMAAGAPLVMVSHALYPAYDDRLIASQSPAILTGLLRRELRFEGAVVTDSLEAEAVLSRSSVEDAAVRSVAAGADLVLLTGRGSYLPVYRRLLATAERSGEFRRRVEETASRVLALKRRLRLAHPSG